MNRQNQPNRPANAFAGGFSGIAMSALVRLAIHNSALAAFEPPWAIMLTGGAIAGAAIGLRFPWLTSALAELFTNLLL